MVIITGANGLIGSYLCTILHQAGFPVRALVRSQSDMELLDEVRGKIEIEEYDLLDTLSLDRYINENDIVIHCAAMISYHQSDHEIMHQINVEGTQTIVNLSQVKNIKKFIHISSIAAIGKNENSRVSDENSQWNSPAGQTAYGISKHLAELEVWRAHAEGMPVVILNPGVVLGPGNMDKSSTQLFKYVWNENKYYTAGSLNYIDLRDIGDVVLKVLETDISGERFILTGGTVSYKHFFEKIGKGFNKKPPTKKASVLEIKFAIFAAKINSILTGKKALITKESAQSGQNKTEYNNTKVQEMLDFKFRELDDSIEWTCSELKKRLEPIL